MATKSFIINPYQLALVEEKIKKLNRKAVKLGIPEIAIIDKREFTIEEKFENAAGYVRTRFVEKIEVTLECETIKIGSYTFVARIDHQEGHGNIVKVVPGLTVPEKYYTADCDCDHCHVRRFRRDTFIFKDNGGYVQVGRTCLKEYFGIDPIKSLEFVGLFGSIDGEFEDSEGGSGRIEYRESTEIALAAGLALVDEYGYISNTRAKEEELTATSYNMYAVLYPHGKYDEELSRNIWEKVRAEGYYDKAKELISWGLEHFATLEGEYAHNMRVILGNDSVKPGYFGYLISLHAVWRKAMGTPKAGFVSANNFIGQVKSKVTVDVTVNKIIPSFGQYGTTYTVLMTEKETGNALVWFASNPPLNEGEEVCLTGTVKDHNERNGVNQTILTRCKVNE